MITLFIKILIISLSIIASSYTQAKIYKVNKSSDGKGYFYPLDSVSVITPKMKASGHTSGDWNDRPTGFSFTTGLPNNYDSRCFNMKSKLLTIDGYTGIKISDGIALVIYDSVVQGTIPAKSGAYLSEGQWNSYGVYSQTNGPSGSTCSWSGSPKSTTVMTAGALVDAKADIKYGVYVSSNAFQGTYNIPKLTLFKGSINSYTVSATVIPDGNQLNISSQQCSISPPELIDFGSINIGNTKDGDLLSVRNGNLSISCNALSTANKVKVTGLTGRSSDTLKVKLDSLVMAPAEIRGIIGNNSEAECNINRIGQIDFSTTGLAKNIGTLEAGINNIPFSFALCSTGGVNTGNATAQATIEITWP